MVIVISMYIAICYHSLCSSYNNCTLQPVNASLCVCISRLQTAVQVRCGLLEVFLSQPSLSTLIKATSSLLDVLQTASPSFLKSKSSLDTETVQLNERDTASRNETPGAGSRLDDPVSFKDDLRTGDFRYVMDETGIHFYLLNASACVQAYMNKNLKKAA